MMQCLPRRLSLKSIVTAVASTVSLQNASQLLPRSALLLLLSGTPKSRLIPWYYSGSPISLDALHTS